MADDWTRMQYRDRQAFTAKLVALYGSTCCICGLTIRSTDELSCQHLTPRSKGGTTTVENCRPAHRSCNYSLGNREQTARVHDGLAFFLTAQ